MFVARLLRLRAEYFGEPSAWLITKSRKITLRPNPSLGRPPHDPVEGKTPSLTAAPAANFRKNRPAVENPHPLTPAFSGERASASRPSAKSSKLRRRAPRPTRHRSPCFCQTPRPP